MAQPDVFRVLGGAPDLDETLVAVPELIIVCRGLDAIDVHADVIRSSVAPGLEVSVDAMLR